MEFANNQAFKTLLQTKRREIQQRTSDGVQETPQFQRLYILLGGCAQKYKENDFHLVIISKDDLRRLDDKANEYVERLFKDSNFISNRTVKVDSKLQIIASDNALYPEKNNDARRYFEALSNGDYVCFLIDPDLEINYFIDGNGYGDGIFYTAQARKAYEELKTIDKLEEVLNEYRIVLKNQDTYVKFFVPKSQLKTLKGMSDSTLSDKQFIQEYKHLLRNKPEECFREDIRNYIKRNMKVVVHRELMLEDRDRLDIELFDEDGKELYFLEIKWVGESIHADGDRLGTAYDETRIKPKAVIQVVGYIKQLQEEKQNIKMGYLIVFDARKENLADTGEGVTEEMLPVELREHYHRYKKLKDFRVINANPL